MKLSYQHYYQPASDPSAPPLLLLHGTGGNERDLVPFAEKISPGSAILSPRGDVLEGGMPRFFRRFAEGVFDLADVARRTTALADFVDAASQHYGIDQTQLMALGFSNGANIGTCVLLKRPSSLAGGVFLRPMVVLDESASGNLTGKRVLISSGEYDPIVPLDHPPRLAEQFRRAGATVSAVMHQASHGLIAADLVAAKKFLSDRGNE